MSMKLTCDNQVKHSLWVSELKWPLTKYVSDLYHRPVLWWDWAQCLVTFLYSYLDKTAIWINDRADIHPLSAPSHHHQPLCRLMVHSQGTEPLQTLLRSEDGCCPAPGLCIRRSWADTHTHTHTSGKLGKNMSNIREVLRTGTQTFRMYNREQAKNMIWLDDIFILSKFDNYPLSHVQCSTAISVYQWLGWKLTGS